MKQTTLTGMKKCLTCHKSYPNKKEFWTLKYPFRFEKRHGIKVQCKTISCLKCAERGKRNAYFSDFEVNDNE